MVAEDEPEDEGDGELDVAATVIAADIKFNKLFVLPPLLPPLDDGAALIRIF